jgi:hypothetical protein
MFVLWKGAAIMGVWDGMIERAGAMAMAMFQNFTILISKVDKRCVVGVGRQQEGVAL